MTIRQKDPRFRNLELKIGIMVAVAIIGIIAAIILVGKEWDIFINKYRIYFISDTGFGFVQGMPVKLSGFKIGRVKKIELTEDARVRVTAEINRKYEKWLREGSKARLSKEGFIGESIIEITKGNPRGRLIADGEMIPYEKTGGIEELVDQAKPVLNEIKEMIHYANSPEGDIKMTLGNIRELTSELRETRKAFDRTILETGSLIKRTEGLINSIDEKSGPAVESAARAMKNLEGLTSRFEPVMLKIENIADKAGSAAERLPVTSEKLERIVDNVVNITDSLSKETPRMRSMLMDAEDTLRDSRAIARGVKESWPVRLMVPLPKKPELVPLDGYLIRRPHRQDRRP